MRNKSLRIFELGIGTTNPNIVSNMGINGRPGASLHGWSEFFPNSQVFGADIDSSILFHTDRIATFYCDQTIPMDIKNMWNLEPDLKSDFDIIIDDGLHTISANVCFFENSIHKLNPGGYYIIEDIQKSQENVFAQKIKEWEKIYTDCTITFLKIPSEKNFLDNSLIVIYKKPEQTE